MNIFTTIVIVLLVFLALMEIFFKIADFFEDKDSPDPSSLPWEQVQAIEDNEVTPSDPTPPLCQLVKYGDWIRHESGLLENGYMGKYIWPDIVTGEYDLSDIPASSELKNILETN